MGKAVVYFFARKNMVGIFALYVCMLKVSYILGWMDWDVRDVSEKGWHKVSKPNCILLMNNSLALTCAIVPQWVFLSSSSIISPTWTCASVPQGVFLSSATS